VLAVLGLKVGDKLAEGLAFLGHHVGEQQAVEQAVALGQVALEADAAGLLAAHDDFALQHVGRTTYLKPMPCSMSSRPYFRADAVEHFGGVEGAGDCAGPAFVLSTQLRRTE
jgi:hypothetical protein